MRLVELFFAIGLLLQQFTHIFQEWNVLLYFEFKLQFFGTWYIQMDLKLLQWFVNALPHIIIGICKFNKRCFVCILYFIKLKHFTNLKKSQ